MEGEKNTEELEVQEGAGGTRRSWRYKEELEVQGGAGGTGRS